MLRHLSEVEEDSSTGDGCSEIHSTGGARYQYADAVMNKFQDRQPKKFKLFVKSTGSENSQVLKRRIKENINPTEMKVGICSVKELRDGRLIIESESREEINKIHDKINEKCGQHMELTIPKLRNPTMIIYNFPEDIPMNEAVAAIRSQNEELNLKQEEIKPKFLFRNKRKNTNLVVEVSSETSKLLLQNKLKIGWHTCRTEDYPVPRRCFKCSKFGHRASECRGQEICPLCSGAHKLKECQAEVRSFKCINCVTYNHYNPNSTVNVNHSSLNKNCPSFQDVLRRYRQNTDY